MSLFHEYQVVGRKLPTKDDAQPKLYRMRLFARDTVVAKSRFWYFLKKSCKVKRATGEIVSVNEIFETGRLRVKNYGIWLRYDTRNGTANLYKEFREVSRRAAIVACYQDMAARHRARSTGIQIIKLAEIPAKSCIRAYTQQFHDKVKFPLMHRVQAPRTKQYRSKFLAHRPTTCK